MKLNMFKDKEIEHFKVKGKAVFIKYFGEPETFLTFGKIDIEDFKKKPHLKRVVNKQG